MKLLLVLVFFLSGCAFNGSKDEKTLHESNIVLTDDLRASRYSNIYFSGQPQKNSWSELKSQGFTHVINLRGDDEYDEKSERQALAKLGVEYTQIPIKAQQPLTKAKVKAVTQAVKAHRAKGQTLVHCSSGNRAALWAGAHFYLDHAYSKAQSIQLAKDMGMTHPKLREKLASFIEANPRAKE